MKAIWAKVISEQPKLGGWMAGQRDRRETNIIWSSERYGALDSRGTRPK